jgi:hypothetical protein
MRKGSNIVKSRDKELPLPDNQFTSSELSSFLKKMYGAKISQGPFLAGDVHRWATEGKMPEAYGGHKLEAAMMSGVMIFTVEGLNREDYGFLKRTKVSPARKINKRKDRRPPRTELYNKIAKVKFPETTLPNNWKEVGIKGNQLRRANKK